MNLNTIALNNIIILNNLDLKKYHVDVKDKVSSIIFSRSNYGLWDAGVNIKRVRGLLASLNPELMADN